MGTNKRLGLLLAVLGAAVLGLQARAGQNTPVSVAPVPTEIVAGQRAFISNGGDECYGLQEDKLSGGPNQSYNQFYANMKNWGRYTLVTNPADADLVFEIQFSCPYGSGNGGDYNGQFRLLILDPKTNVMLWTIIEHVEGAIRATTAEKNFAVAANAIVDDVKKLAGQGPAGSAH
jgi:hypothetical protein